MYWVAWSQLAGLGPVTLRRLWQHFGDLKTAWIADRPALMEVEGIGATLASKIVAQRQGRDLEAIWAAQIQTNPHFWTPADANYPQLLLEIPSFPPVLYYEGQTQIAENSGQRPMIAMVGTRYPTPHGREWAATLAQALAQQGFTVVSGMAAGIDGAAHQACLQTGGRTWAVLGTGVDQIYPPEHRSLRQAIAQQGLIISEYPRGTRPQRAHFPARNRLITGLCRAVIVVEAPESSGALITAHYATEFNRDVYIVPNSPKETQALGCLKLWQQGAYPILGVADLLEQLGDLPQLDRTPPGQPQQLSLLPPAPPIHLSAELRTLWQAIPPTPVGFDALVAQLDQPAPLVSAQLLQLELEGLIEQLPGLHYRRR
jgi:DNA processing protein